MHQQNPLLLHGSKQPQITLICQSMSLHRAQEAMQAINSYGVAINIIELTTIDPFPADKLAALCRAIKHTMIIEESHMPSLQEMLWSQAGINLSHTILINSVDPESTIQIINMVQNKFLV